MPAHARSCGPPPRRWGLAALLVVATLVLGACGTTASVNAAPARAHSVLPKGAEIVHPSPPKVTKSCTASLPPPTTMPTPGQMPKGSYMAQIQARGYLNVGVDRNKFLWGYRDPVTDTDTLTGFDIEMLQQIAIAIFGSADPKYFRTVPVLNADRISAVQTGKVDVLAETMTITCERKKSVDFSTEYYQAEQKILVPDNSTITGTQDLGGKRVCAPAKSTSLQNLVRPGMPRKIQLWAATDTTDCLVMLQQGQVDAVSTDDAILLGLAAQDPNTKIVGPGFSPEPYGMAISKSHPGFTSFVNGVLAQVSADGTWTKIYDANLLPYIGGTTPATDPAPSYG